MPNLKRAAELGIGDILRYTKKEKTTMETESKHPLFYGGMYKHLKAVAADVHANDGATAKEIAARVGISIGYTQGLIGILRKTGIITPIPTVTRSMHYGLTNEAKISSSFVETKLKPYDKTEAQRHKQREAKQDESATVGGKFRTTQTENYVTRYGNLIVCHTNGGEFIFTPKTAKRIYNLLGTAGRLKYFDAVDYRLDANPQALEVGASV